MAGCASQERPVALKSVGLTEQPQRAHVFGVIDGNTIIIGFVSDGPDDDSVELVLPYRAKLLAVRAPKHDDCYAQRSKAALEDLVLNKAVTVTWDSGDKYTAHGGDFLVYLSIGSIDINAVMIENGDALVAERWPAKNKAAYRILQEEAKSAPSGAWRKKDQGGCVPNDYVP